MFLFSHQANFNYRIVNFKSSVMSNKLTITELCYILAGESESENTQNLFHM